jgi:hypothetical protein
MIQVRSVPDELHRTLKSHGARAGMTLSDFLLAEIRAVAERPTPAEMRYRLARSLPARVSGSSASAVRAERDSR